MKLMKTNDASKQRLQNDLYGRIMGGGLGGGLGSNSVHGEQERAESSSFGKRNRL